MHGWWGVAYKWLGHDVVSVCLRVCPVDGQGSVQGRVVYLGVGGCRASILGGIYTRQHRVCIGAFQPGTPLRP